MPAAIRRADERRHRLLASSRDTRALTGSAAAAATYVAAVCNLLDFVLSARSVVDKDNGAGRQRSCRRLRSHYLLGMTGRACRNQQGQSYRSNDYGLHGFPSICNNSIPHGIAG
jgi:hypothetical protein